MYVCIVAAWHDIFVTTILETEKRYEEDKKKCLNNNQFLKKICPKRQKIQRERAIKLIQNSRMAEGPEI